MATIRCDDRGMKTWIIVTVLVLLAAIAVVGLRRDQQLVELPEGAAGGGMAGALAFRVRVAVPPAGRAFFGMLPSFIEDNIEGAAPRELSFDHTSPGAAAGIVGPDRIGLRNADGWDLYIETDGEGRIKPATYAVFPIYLGERHVKLRCRPLEPPVGHLRSLPAGEGKLSGDFLVELDNCKNADSNKNVDWPPAPLELRGSFAGLPAGAVTGARTALLR